MVSKVMIFVFAGNVMPAKGWLKVEVARISRSNEMRFSAAKWKYLRRATVGLERGHI